MKKKKIRIFKRKGIFCYNEGMLVIVTGICNIIYPFVKRNFVRIKILSI